MNHFRVPGWRMFFGIASVLALTLPAIPALGQGVTGVPPTTSSTTTRISIDSPSSGATITTGSQVQIGGWAADTMGPGTGIDMVQIFLDGTMDGGGTLLGNATYGGARPDVAASLGSSAFTNTGFDFQWTPANLSGGNHTLYVYAHATNGAWSLSSVTLSSAATPTPLPRSGGGGYNGGYGQQGPTTPYGGSFLYNPGGGYGGYGQCTPGFSDPYAPGCGGPPPYGGIPPYPIPPPPPPPPPPGYPGQPCILIYPPDPSCTGYPTPIGTTVVAPTGLTVTGVTGTTVTLTWGASTGAVSYRVYQSIAGGAFVPSVMNSQTGTSAIISGLTPNTPYTFQVVAIGTTGTQSGPSNNVPITTTPGP